ncbi:hypothetical protein [Flavobacterium sp. AG291]|uniref:hypothetical protein n=1 Tax=Flavobacterium sp. AG291 TaxID=2184000 RepID=UPI000E0AB5AA|nr:hypothetical protein [Flavobacterium sp. AG291]RDI14540.1 hypothetical protein DEU42_102237 [Flavobacterium sp. AG291]
MKKIFCLVATLILIAGCDDGDMGYKTFDFTDVDPVSCTNNVDDVSATTETYYKITGTEGLILIIAKGTLINATNPDPNTGENLPRIITLGTANTLTYYDFVSKPTGTLCTKSDIPAAKENGIWTGQGTLSVLTLPNIDKDTGKLLGYRHTITLENISFNQGDEKITIVNSEFGDIDKDFDFDFDFIQEGTDVPNVESCTNNSKLIYTRKAERTLSLDLANFDTLFDNEVETDTIELEGNTEDIVLFNIYKSTATSANICNQGSQVPSLPIQKWQMIGGQVLITTTETGGLYNHDIYLKDAVFRNNLGDVFLLNDIIEVPDSGYYFGRY